MFESNSFGKNDLTGHILGIASLDYFKGKKK